MIIGLYDADMSKYIHTCFNLELMKLSSYYKKRKEIVLLSPEFSLDQFNKFIYRKDYQDGEYPSELLTNPKIVYGGKAFGDIYQPLEDDIEKQKADKYIYKAFNKLYCNTKNNTRIFNNLMNSEHFRLSLDNKNIWNDFSKQFELTGKTRLIMLHDYNLNQIKEADYAIKDIISSSTRKNQDVYLGTKFPIQVNNINDLEKWLKLPAASELYLLQYNGILNDDFFCNILKTYSNTHLRQFNYNISSFNFNEEEFIKKDIFQLFYQMIYNKMNRGRIQIYYDESLFKNPMWCEVLRLFNSYSLSTLNLKEEKFNRAIKFDSLYSYASGLRDKNRQYRSELTKDEAREIFRFVKDNNYELFKSFYEVHTVELKGGKLQPC